MDIVNPEINSFIIFSSESILILLFFGIIFWSPSSFGKIQFSCHQTGASKVFGVWRAPAFSSYHSDWIAGIKVSNSHSNCYQVNCFRLEYYYMSLSRVRWWSEMNRRFFSASFNQIASTKLWNKFTAQVDLIFYCFVLVSTYLCFILGKTWIIWIITLYAGSNLATQKCIVYCWYS